MGFKLMSSIKAFFNSSFLVFFFTTFVSNAWALSTFANSKKDDVEVFTESKDWCAAEVRFIFKVNNQEQLNNEGLQLLVKKVGKLVESNCEVTEVFNISGGLTLEDLTYAATAKKSQSWKIENIEIDQDQFQVRQPIEKELKTGDETDANEDYVFSEETLDEIQQNAENSDPEAQVTLGKKYDFGEGVEENDAEAVKWYRKAAEQGYAKGQYYLGQMYYFGLGVNEDMVEAYVWYSVAAEQGNEDAVSALEGLRNKITLAQSAEADRRISELFSNHNTETTAIDSPYSTDSSESTTTESIPTPKERPISGTVFAYIEEVNTSSVAPFEIKTSGDFDYYLKLVDAESNVDVMGVYVRGEETAEVSVSLGNYEVRYASGSIWYGEDELFGVNTVYSKADSTFNFKRDGDQISGFSLTLFNVSNGNLTTAPIDASKF